MRTGGKFKKNMNNQTPTFEEFCNPAYRRAQQVTIKSEAAWVAFLELRNILNTSGLAREYFKRSPSWILQRINGNKVFGKKAEFTESEYHQLAEAFRDIARRLTAHADEIDAAAMDEID